MAELLVMAGFLGGIGCIVWFIVRLFKRKQKKPAGLGIVLCFVALVAGGALYTPESTESRSAPSPGEPVEAELPASQSTVGQNTIPESSPSASQASQIRQDGAVTYKLPNGAELDFYDSVPGDVTGRWRVAVTSSSTSPSNYAVDYYNNVFSSDDEIHAICDPALGTTTRLMVNAGLLFVDTLKYVDGEERDAKFLFSGDVVRSKILDKETGRPVELEQTEESPSPSTAPSQSPSPSVAPSQSVSPSQSETPASQPVQSNTTQGQTGNSGGGRGNADNFYTYDNPEQQNTDAKWVLNTSSKKIHYPNCGEVKKIAPKNYSESNLSESELLGQGYTTCKKCH